MKEWEADLWRLAEEGLKLGLSPEDMADRIRRMKTMEEKGGEDHD